MRTLLCILLVLGAIGPVVVAEPIEVSADARLTTLRGAAFGTTFHVKLISPQDPRQIRDLIATIEAAISQINAQMSLWDDESELSRFNRDVGGDWFPVSEETLKVVEAALQIREASQGAFDPTVLPVLALWRFGPNQRPRQVPGDDDIQAALSLVGAGIQTRHSPAPALKKAVAGVQLDLNAIAKGYAVDVIADLVAVASPRGGMIEVGGEVRTFGTKPDGSGWRIAIEQPLAGQRTADSFVTLKDSALATSGDYRNYFEQNGQRFSHTIDPRSGRPITHRLASVSVVAADCMTADAWATALMVLGPEAGYNRALKQQIAVLFLIREGDTFLVRTTPEFPTLMALNPPMDSLWTTFLIAGGVFLTAVAGMAIGVIVSNRRLRGSCGGLNGLKDPQGNAICEACTTPPEECDEFRQKMTAAARSDDCKS